MRAPLHSFSKRSARSYASSDCLWDVTCWESAQRRRPLGVNSAIAASLGGACLQAMKRSRSSIERVGHAVGAEYLRRREAVEPCISVDRVTVPMEEPAPRQLPDAPVSTAKKPSAATVREYGHELSARTRAVLSEAKRRSHGPRAKIQRNYRMASNRSGWSTRAHELEYGGSTLTRESRESVAWHVPVLESVAAREAWRCEACC
jgi:hypothetical protein